jgi:hypothetical protein
MGASSSIGEIVKVNKGVVIQTPDVVQIPPNSIQENSNSFSISATEKKEANVPKYITQKDVDAVVIILFLLGMAGVVFASLAFINIASAEHTGDVPEEPLTSKNKNSILDSHPTPLTVYTAGEGITVANREIRLSRFAGFRMMTNPKNSIASPILSEDLSPFDILLGGGRSTLETPSTVHTHVMTSINGRPEWSAAPPYPGPFPIRVRSDYLQGGSGYLTGFNANSAQVFIYPYVVDLTVLNPIFGAQIWYSITATTTGSTGGFGVQIWRYFPLNYQSVGTQFRVVGNGTSPGHENLQSNGSMLINGGVTPVAMMYATRGSLDTNIEAGSVVTGNFFIGGILVAI